MPALQQQAGGSFNPMIDLEQSKTTPSQLARIGGNEINFQPQSPQDEISSINWMSATAQPASMSQNRYESLPMQQQVAQEQQQQPFIRRTGELNTASTIIGNDPKYSFKDIKPVKSDRAYSSALPTSYSTNQAQNLANSGGLFSSLTSSLANVKNIKLMNRIMNANGNENQQTNSYRMMSLGDVSEPQKFFSYLKPNREHLNDKHRYSLVARDDNNLNEQQLEKLSPSSKPFSLSAMTHAITSMFDSPLAESGSSSSSYKQHVATAPMSSSEINSEQHTHSMLSDKTLSRRQQQAGNSLEQRDLSLLLPQSWKEVVKRTVNNVKQEASTQWRSIEGQLTNWVQDKLKTFPVPSASSSSSSSSSGSSSPAAAPVANIIASVSSTAMNILGLSNKSPSSSPSVTHSATASSNSNDSASVHGSQTSAANNESPSVSQRGGKTDAPGKTTSGSGKGGALAGVANMIVNTLTSRTSAPSSSHSSSTSSHSKIADDSVSGVISQYPTLKGAQPSQETVNSMASGTASTVAAMSTMSNN